jgi:hypothetical protein
LLIFGFPINSNSIKGSSLKISENLAQGVARYGLFSEDYPCFHQNLEILKKNFLVPQGLQERFWIFFYGPEVSKQVNEPI